MIAIAAAALLGAAIFAGSAQAQTAHELDGAQPSIWTDPDGCQHFAIYNGWQGFMTPVFRADGSVQCKGGAQQPCLVASTDQLFATGSYSIGFEGRRRLTDFFQHNGATSFTINGHTDNVGGYDYNIGLSNNRANAVAAIARQAGANVAGTQGFGYTQPRADNATASGRALNRRVEVMCN
jgi:outer membrane protein OmpA-like peptidoglycan-associated protein